MEFKAWRVYFHAVEHRLLANRPFPGVLLTHSGILVTNNAAHWEETAAGYGNANSAVYCNLTTKNESALYR